MKTLFKYHGGSHSYGINTSESDIDLRYGFLHTDISRAIGLDRFEHMENVKDGADEKGKEFRHILNLLQRGNSECVEFLFNKNWLEISDEWKIVMLYRDKLFDSKKLFSCLRGYMQGELRAALGITTGKLGEKRATEIERWGFSRKNACQVIRLAWAGETYFKENHFPVNIREYNSNLASMLLEMKTKPENFTVDRIKFLAAEYEEGLVEAFENRAVSNVFDIEVANRLCLQFYFPVLQDSYRIYFPESDGMS